MRSIKQRALDFRFDWKLSLFVLLLFPVLLKLGFWQLAREDEKLDLQKKYERQLASPAVMLGSVDPDSELQFQRVLIRGRYDNERMFLLDNRVVDGSVGFEVINLFIAENGQQLFVNRGWAPMGEYRTDLPEVVPVEDTVQITASIYVPVGEPVMLAVESYRENWPKIIQSIDIEKMAIATGVEGEIFPYTVRLEENTPGVLVRNWQPYSSSPEKHRGYAVQWFSMATVLLLLYLYASTRPPTNQKPEA